MQFFVLVHVHDVATDNGDDHVWRTQAPVTRQQCVDIPSRAIRRVVKADVFSLKIRYDNVHTFLYIVGYVLAHA